MDRPWAACPVLSRDWRVALREWAWRMSPSVCRLRQGHGPRSWGEGRGRPEGLVLLCTDPAEAGVAGLGSQEGPGSPVP